MVAAATALLWSTVTAFARGPVLIRQMMEKSGRDCIPPNLAQLWVCWMEFFGPTRRTAASTSLTRAFSLLLIVVDRANASMNAFMFLLASMYLARFLKCCTQELLRIVIFNLLRGLYCHCWQYCHFVSSTFLPLLLSLQSSLLLNCHILGIVGVAVSLMSLWRKSLSLNAKVVALYQSSMSRCCCHLHCIVSANSCYKS